MEKVSLDEFGTGRNFRLGIKGVEMAGKQVQFKLEGFLLKKGK